jgi:hypothetical protein
MTQKVGRNEPCPCGSGAKYKKCCGKISMTQPSALPYDIKHLLEKRQAQERIREKQQGMGRPIISGKMNGHQMVAVANKVFWSPTWKAFPDFLGDYFKRVLGPEWGNAELAKPFDERHQILQWYDAYCRYQQKTIANPGEITEAVVTGVVACYLGLAYSLYLLDHNVELQSRLIQRLKNPGNFQGAYYELMVANALIRAGFTLTLEDEADEASKHCEFAAVSKRTGKKYWVEAKMRAVPGFFGKTDSDGSPDPNPISRLIPHLNGALRKPASDERLIFIDLNTLADSVLREGGKPSWHDKAVARLEGYEVRELARGVRAYVFVTNFPFHRMLNTPAAFAAVPFGLGMPDFNRAGPIRLADGYRQKQKHADAFHIGESLLRYLSFPSTFDGSLPSETFEGRPPRVVIGGTYLFEGIGEGGTLGTVATATVNESQSLALIGINDQSGNGQVLTYPMSNGELSDYKTHPEAYFGRLQVPSRKIQTVVDMFEFLMEANKNLTRGDLLAHLANWPNFDSLKSMNDDELRAEYCEGMVGAFHGSGFKMGGVSPRGSA